MKNGIKMWLCVSGILLLTLGCDKKGSSGQSSGGRAKIPMVISPATPSKEGTVDGGGGAGLDGKPIESYQIDVSKLSEYKKFIEPVLASLAKFHPEYANLFKHIVTSKTWYMIPRELPAISKDKMGIPVNSDQWALQNDRSIWISELLYKGEESDRALILMHEILVGLKILRYASFEEICSIAYDGDVSSCGGSQVEKLKENATLSKEDYDNVRALGPWLIKNHSTITAEDFANEMYNKRMDGIHIQYGKYLKFSMSAAEAESKKTSVQRTMDVYEYAKVVKRNSGKVHSMFSGYHKHFADMKCEAKYEVLPNNQFRFELKLKGKNRTNSPTELSGTLTVDISEHRKYRECDAKTEMCAFQLSADSLKATPWAVGDRSLNIDLIFRYGELIEIFGSEMEVTSADGKGGGSSQSIASISCFQSEVYIPFNYPLWKLYPKEDREFFERKDYGGKTLQELKDEGLFQVGYLE